MSGTLSDSLLQQIEKEIPRLRRYAKALTRDPDAADDLVQDCLVRAIANLSTWQAGTNLCAWLMTILRNKFLNDCRRKKRERAVMVDQIASDVGFVRPQQDTHADMVAFEDAFWRLSTEHRKALMLVAVEGYQYEEAAKIIDISVGTVKSRVSRARSNLRQLIDAT